MGEFGAGHEDASVEDEEITGEMIQAGVVALEMYSESLDPWGLVQKVYTAMRAVRPR